MPAAVSKLHATPPIAPAALLDTEALARRLGTSVKTVEGWRLKGGGPPYIKVQRLVRYRPEDVEAWLDAKVRLSTSDPGRAA